MKTVFTKFCSVCATWELTSHKRIEIDDETEMIHRQ